MSKIWFVVASPESARAFLFPHLARLSLANSVVLVMNGKASDLQFSGFLDAKTSTQLGRIEIKSCPINRRPHLFLDIWALSLLVAMFSRSRPDVVISFGPKAGLLASIAGALTSVANRIHWFTGQVWAYGHSVRYPILRFFDKITASMATHLLVDSTSQMRFIVEQGIVPREKCSVIGNGSIRGVNLQRFSPSVESRKLIRKKISCSNEAIVTIFSGRMTPDKGLIDLALAYSSLKFESEHLLCIMGSDEASIGAEISAILRRNGKRVVFTGHQLEPEAWIAASDIFCLPSYREGFGVSVIEAAASEVPALLSDIYGLQDSAVHNETALYFPVGDIAALGLGLAKLHENKDFRLELGRNARERVQALFSEELVVTGVESFVRSLSEISRPPGV